MWKRALVWLIVFFALWFDQHGNGVGSPVDVVPDPGHKLMSSATTRPDGSFVLPALPRVGPGSAPVTVEYVGDDTHRPVTWSPSR